MRSALLRHLYVQLFSLSLGRKSVSYLDFLSYRFSRLRPICLSFVSVRDNLKILTDFDVYHWKGLGCPYGNIKCYVLDHNDFFFSVIFYWPFGYHIGERMGNFYFFAQKNIADHEFIFAVNFIKWIPRDWNKCLQLSQFGFLSCFSLYCLLSITLSIL